MGKASRDKGRRGQSAAKLLLGDRDWIVADLSSGLASEDIIAVDPDGVTWAIEVKNTANILESHREQAMRQAKARKARWMLMSHISGTAYWLVQRQGEKPMVWC